MEIRIIFTFNGMFMLYLEIFCPRKSNGGNQIMKTDVVFPYFLLRIQKRHAHDMVFWKTTIIMANKDDHRSCVLTQICIAYNLILTCRWYVKFDVNVFGMSNVTILHYKTEIAYTCCKQL